MKVFSVGGKKALHWHCSFGTIKVTEPLFRQGKQQIRPFCESSGVIPRGYSLPLQRIVADFGADHAFGKAQKKLQEHYCLNLPTSSIRHITLHHGEQMLQQQQLIPEYPKVAGCDQLIVETDGSFIPIMTPDPEQADQRKGKTLHWQEVKLSLAHRQGSTELKFGASFQRGPEASGQQWLRCAILAGLGRQTQVHGVGDGATWITKQLEEQFGSQGTYLLDFYHVCEYLAAAANACSAHLPENWLAQQKQRLRQSDITAVMNQLNAQREQPEAFNTDEVDNAVQKAYNYLDKRRDQLNYQQAIDNGLPIGSGEIESAHRYVVQERMKLAGAWWNAANAESMMALKVEQNNEGWDAYWKQHAKIREAA